MHSVWKTSIRFTLVTTLLLGLGYPLVVTGIAKVIFPHQAGGSLLHQRPLLPSAALGCRQRLRRHGFERLESGAVF
jgi:K+-transporting ATPase c subunit